jgi:cell wall-associated NlpC family hydrolase
MEEGMSISKTITVLATLLLTACNWQPKTSDEGLSKLEATDSLHAKDSSTAPVSVDTATRPLRGLPPTVTVRTGSTKPEALVAFARTLVGVPYVYGSTDPRKGFDCSGFVTHVFNHFGISVPRSSVDFTHVGREVSPAEARPGDLVLFTGTHPGESAVGHMGIVTENRDTLRFIHSTSGKAMGVTVTPLNGYYLNRYVKTIRVFE